MAEVSAAQKTKKVSFSEELLKDIHDLRTNSQHDSNDRNQWESKLAVASNQRLGVKRPNANSYPGAPNYPVQEADKQIRKKKPSFVMAVAGSNKPAQVHYGATILQVTPEIQAKRARAEIGFNHVLMKEMNWLKVATKAADQFLEKGHCIFKTTEKLTSNIIHKVIDTDNDFEEQIMEAFKQLTKEEKRIVIAERYELIETDEDDSKIIDDILEQYNSGKRIIEFDIEKVSSLPKVEVPESERVVVPSWTGDDIGEAERVRHEFYLTKRELIERGLSGAYNLKKVKENIKSTNPRDNRANTDTLATRKDLNEGVTQKAQGEVYRMWEIEAWRDTGPRGAYERWVFTFMQDVADDEESTVSINRFPYSFDTWNYDKHDNEVKDNRYLSSRGIPEMIRGGQELMERALNNIVIRDEVNNSPMFTVLSTSKIQPSSIRFIPGQRIKVFRHDEIMELGGQRSKLDLSSLQIFQLIKGFVEEYLGSTDQLFRNATNAGGGKTLGEIKFGVGLSQNLLNLELMLFNETLKSVYKKVWTILRDRLGDPINVNGVLISKEDFDFDGVPTPTGTIEMLDKQQLMQQAAQRISMLLNLRGIVVNSEDIFNAVEDYLSKEGEKSPERFITRPEQIMSEQQQVLQAQQQLLQEEEAKVKQEAQQVQAKAAAQEVNQPTRGA